MIDKLNFYLFMILLFVVFALIIGTGFFIYSRKYRKRRKNTENEVDYSSFIKKDTREYVKIDDIRDNMIVTDKKTRFIGAIKCDGFSFYTARPEEQYAVMNAYQSFFSVINGPVTYRQSCRKIDVDKALDNYIKAGDKQKQTLEDLKFEHQNLVDQLEFVNKNAQDTTNMQAIADLENLMKAIDEIEHKIEVASWRLNHIVSQMDELSYRANSDDILDRDDVYLFEWVYNASDYPYDLDEHEIIEKAIIGLREKEFAMIHALANARVKATRMKTSELEDLFRHHYHPITADIYKESDFANSSYDDDIVTTNPNEDQIVKDMVEEQKINEEYEKVIAQEQELERIRQESLKSNDEVNEEPNDKEGVSTDEFDFDFAEDK